MGIESSLKHTHARERLRNRDGIIITKTVHEDDVTRPIQRAESARDIGRFVVREYQGCDLVEHLALWFTCVANHVLPEPRRAAVERDAEIVEPVGPHEF